MNKTPYLTPGANLTKCSRSTCSHSFGKLDCFFIVYNYSNCKVVKLRKFMSKYKSGATINPGLAMYRLHSKLVHLFKPVKVTENCKGASLLRIHYPFSVFYCFIVRAQHFLKGPALPSSE